MNNPSKSVPKSSAAASHSRPPEFLFNPAAEEIPEALSIRFNQMVYELRRAKRDVTCLSLGEAFFDIPQFDFNAIDFVKGYHYSDSQGIPELRVKIAEYYKRYGASFSASEVLVSAGSKPLVYMAMLAVLQPGEEVVLHEPCWVSYSEQARLCGARARFIPYDIPVSEFHRYMSPRARILVLNNPNNPAGRLYTREEIKAAYDLCASRGMYLMVDEAYSDFASDGEFVSAAAVAPDLKHLIIINSLSKNMGISGWRIGYAVAHPEFLKVLLKINQHLITCAPTILLLYCANYFDDILNCTLPQVRAVVEKRRRIAKVLDGLGLKSMPGSGTFYFFVSLGNYPGTSMDFGLELLRNHAVSVVPGSAYGQSTERYIRVGIGSEPEERIHVALKKIGDLITQTRPSGAVFTSEQALDEQPPAA